MKRPKGNKKSILMKLPDVETEKEVCKEQTEEEDIKNTEEDIFSIKPIEEQEILQKEEIKHDESKDEIKDYVEPIPTVRKKRPCSEKQLAALKRNREKRLNALAEKKKLNQINNNDNNKIEHESSSYIKEKPQKSEKAVHNINNNINNDNNNDNDFEKFMENYSKFQKFEKIVLEKNNSTLPQRSIVYDSRSKTPVNTPTYVPTITDAPKVKPINIPKPAVVKPKVDYAFSLNRRKNRGGFY